MGNDTRTVRQVCEAAGIRVIRLATHDTVEFVVADEAAHVVRKLEELEERRRDDVAALQATIDRLAAENTELLARVEAAEPSAAPVGQRHAWWVWELELPDEGASVFDAATADEAMRLYEESCGGRPEEIPADEPWLAAEPVKADDLARMDAEAARKESELSARIAELTRAAEIAEIALRQDALPDGETNVVEWARSKLAAVLVAGGDTRLALTPTAPAAGAGEERCPCGHPPHLGPCTRRNGGTANPCPCLRDTLPIPTTPAPEKRRHFAADGGPCPSWCQACIDEHNARLGGETPTATAREGEVKPDPRCAFPRCLCTGAERCEGVPYVGPSIPTGEEVGRG